MLLRFQKFGGVLPTINPSTLPDHASQVARNCIFWNNDLSPIQGLGQPVSLLAKPGVIKSLYRFGQDVEGDANYWFHWTTDVDVVRSQIFGDTTEKTFFTGDGAPKYTDNAVALAGTQYPVVSYLLGVPVPTAPTGGTIAGTGSGVALSTSFVYTIVDDNGWEGPPSPVLEIPSVKLGQTVLLESLMGVQAGYRMSVAGGAHHRIYQANTSGTFMYAGRTTDIAQTTFTATIVSQADGDALTSTTFDPPPATLAGLVELHNGMNAGFTGNDVYVCEAYKPWAWSTDYRFSTAHPVVGLGAFDQALVVLTKGVPVVAQGSDPASMTPVPLKGFRQACVSKRSIVQLSGGVMYASPDGLCMITPNGPSIVTAGAFARKEWQRLIRPESIHAYRSEDRYIGFFDNGQEKGAFVVDLTSPNNPFSFLDLGYHPTAGYNDLLNDGLYLAVGNTVRRFMGGDPLPYTWRSKRVTMSTPACLSWGRVLASEYPVDLSIYAEGVLIDEISVQSDDPFRTSISDRCRTYEVEVSGTSAVVEVALAHSAKEIAGG